jgi:small subunit ribosomal protein S5
VVESAGIKDLLTKSLGSPNPINLVRATVSGLENLHDPEEIARRRGRPISEIMPQRRLAGVST